MARCSTYYKQWHSGFMGEYKHAYHFSAGCEPPTISYTNSTCFYSAYFKADAFLRWMRKVMSINRAMEIMMIYSIVRMIFRICDLNLSSGYEDASCLT